MSGVPVDLKALMGKLNQVCRRTLENAAGLCQSRSNYNIEIEHWLLKLLEEPNTDIQVIFKQYGVDVSRLSADLTKTLDKQKTGNARTPAISPDIVDLARDAWLLGSIQFGATSTRTGHVLTALVSSETLALKAQATSVEFGKISGEKLRQELPMIMEASQEVGGEAHAGSKADPTQPKKAGPTPNLDQFTIDVTGEAKAGKIDPILGRDDEIRQVIDILTRRRQNNPILTGEAGVGKTAVVEGFAQRIVAGDVPPPLKNVSVRSLDLGLLQAGAGIKGEFENRLKGVIEEVKASPVPIILFIDEAHTLIGAGGQAGQGDAGQMLKPALARGELRTIAATTWAEYKKYFEKDAALTRRFQVVKVEEPTEPVAVEMMRGLVETLENHHNVRILDEAVVESVRLSNRYISGRQLPDKSVSLLDTACARVGLSQVSVPPRIEDLRQRSEQIERAVSILEREVQTGLEHDEQLQELAEEKENVASELAELEERWNKELELVAKIREIREQIEPKKEVAAAGIPSAQPQAPTEPAPEPAPEAVAAAEKAKAEVGVAVAEPGSNGDSTELTDEQRSALREQLINLNGELKELQGETPLIQVCVDGQSIAEVVANWTGIPVGRMVADEINTILNLKEEMGKRVVGQDHALNIISQTIKTSRASLADERKPIGVFILVGTSGVGKTETAIALADLLYGGEQNMSVINMSEFKEEHKVSLLMGSPPGYVGYGEGGVLTEAVRRRPYSVVLLDEIEKAHPGVQDIFYQVFDKGTLRDGEGRDINFKNTVIILTSNVGTDLLMKLAGPDADPDTMPDPEGLQEALYPELLKVFKPAFLGRINVVPYYPLGDEVMKKIIRLQLDRIGKRIYKNYKAPFSYSDELVDTIKQRCTEVQSGARNVDHILSRTLLPELSSEFLSRMAEGHTVNKVHVSSDEAGNFVYELS